MIAHPAEPGKDVVTSEILAPDKPRHRHNELLSFLKHIDANVPAALNVHLIMDSNATYKRARVNASLAKHPRYHVHYNPTYSSWLNQVELSFGLIAEGAIRRGSFRTVRILVRRTEHFVDRYTTTSRSFAWTVTAHSSTAEFHRLLSRFRRSTYQDCPSKHKVNEGGSCHPRDRTTIRNFTKNSAAPASVNRGS